MNGGGALAAPGGLLPIAASPFCLMVGPAVMMPAAAAAPTAI